MVVGRKGTERGELESERSRAERWDADWGGGEGAETGEEWRSLEEERESSRWKQRQMEDSWGGKVDGAAAAVPVPVCRVPCLWIRERRGARACDCQAATTRCERRKISGAFSPKPTQFTLQQLRQRFSLYRRTKETYSVLVLTSVLCVENREYQNIDPGTLKRQNQAHTV